MKITAEILRDLAKFPSEVTISRAGRKLKTTFDPDKGFIFEGHRSILPTIPEILNLIYPVQSVITVRGQNWYDRNTESLADYYGAELSPHVNTERISYECPVDRKAMVEVLEALVIRTTAATAAAIAHAHWTLTPEGGTEEYILYAVNYGNNVNDGMVTPIGASLMLNQGDILKGYTRDASTDGKHLFYLPYKISEFDA